MKVINRLTSIWRRVFLFAKTPQTAIRTIKFIYRRQGVSGVLDAIRFVIRTSSSNGAYSGNPFDFPAWFSIWTSKYSYPDVRPGPKISIVLPVFDPPLKHLKSAIQSVLDQSFETWELCIADDCSTNPEIISYLKELPSIDPRIKVAFRETNGHISEASNSAIRLSTGDFIAFLDHDDVLMPWALAEVAKAILENPCGKFFYSDEMTIDGNGNPVSSHFKSDLNREMARAMNYFCHLSVYASPQVLNLGLRKGYEGAQDFDLALRVIEQLSDSEVVHIPKILYGWRAIAGSTAKDFNAKPYALGAGKLALQDHLKRMAIDGEVEENLLVVGTYRIHYKTIDEPKVSIVVPTKNQYGILRACISSLLELTEYKNTELIIIDNGSDQRETLDYLEYLRTKQVKVIVIDEPFNYARLNNLAAVQATGDYICLLNNDIEITNGDWLSEMLSVAQRPDVGAVGAKLFYPDGTIQHAGVILGIGGVAGHSFRSFSKFNAGYAGRASLGQEVAAVTAACLLVKTAKYTEVGGLTEELAIGYNDVDFCLKLRAAGYHNIYWPFAEMIHHESKSRGYDNTPEKIARAADETIFMEKRWKISENPDPFYNPNLSKILKDFSLNWDFQ